MPTAEEVRQRRPLAGGGGKETPVSFLSLQTFPRISLDPLKLPSQFVRSLAAHTVGLRQATAAQRGRGGWGAISHHFPHQRCGWIHRNVADILRSSLVFFASPGASSSPLKSVHRTAKPGAASSGDWPTTSVAVGRSLGRCSGRSRPSFRSLFVFL